MSRGPRVRVVPTCVLPVPVSTALDRGDERLGSVVAQSATEAKTTAFARWRCGLCTVDVQMLLFSIERVLPDPLLLIIIVIVFVVLSSAAHVLRCRRRNVLYCRVSCELPVVVHCIYIYDLEFSVCVRAVIGNC